MRALLCLILIPTFGFGQIIIGPLTEGEYFNEVVYEGFYISPGNCTWNDGIDFYLDFSGLTEIDGMEYAFIVDAPDPDSTVLMNGWLPVNVGDSTVFTPSTTGLGISAASNPAQLNFHIRLVGIPTTAGQAHPCWIDQIQTLGVCDNMWSLFNGETPLACTVQTSTGIENHSEPVSIETMKGHILITTQEEGMMSMFTADGQVIFNEAIRVGENRIKTKDHKGLVIIQVQTNTKIFSKKILLQ